MLYGYTLGPLEKIAPSGVGLEQVDLIFGLTTCVVALSF
jgi:hypothetical protein